MAIVRYQCDTCKRVIEHQQNAVGLEIYGRCIITDDCRGKLHQTEVLPTFLIGTLPPDVEGLNNWVQRKLLYTHNQTLSQQVWEIKHFLATEPSVQTHIYLGPTLTEVTPDSITTVDKNTTLVTFSEPFRGIAQLISRSTNISQPVAKKDVAVVAETFSQGSSASTTAYNTIPPGDKITIYWFDSKSNSLGFTTSDIKDNSTILSWKDYNSVFYKGKNYNIYNINVNPPAGADDGSHFYFHNENDLPFTANEAFMLFTNSPFSSFDIVKNKLHDFSIMNENNDNAFQFSSLLNGEILIADSQIPVIYPSLL